MFHFNLVLKIYWTTGDVILKKHPKQFIKPIEVSKNEDIT